MFFVKKANKNLYINVDFDGKPVFFEPTKALLFTHLRRQNLSPGTLRYTQPERVAIFLKNTGMAAESCFGFGALWCCSSFFLLFCLCFLVFCFLFEGLISIFFWAKQTLKAWSLGE